MLKYYLKQDNASPHTTLACFDKTQTLIKSLMEFLSDLKNIFSLQYISLYIILFTKL